MSFKDLLVVVDHGRNCPARIDLAARLARDFGAHLTGLYVNTIPSMQPVVLSEFPLEVREVHTRAMREASARRGRSSMRASSEPVSGSPRSGARGRAMRRRWPACMPGTWTSP